MHASGKKSTSLVGLAAFVLLFAFGFTDDPKHAPLTLDYIHYHVNDAQAARKFFVGHFHAHALAKPEKNPLPFVEYLEIRSGQASIAISPRGPFPGLNMQDPARWRRTPIRMTPNTPPAYGVHWLALRTENLKLALQSLERQGVKIAAADAQVPGEPHAKAAVVWGPEYTRILIIQRGGEKRQETLYGIDHLLILVENLAENVRFFEEVYEGEVLKKDSYFCKMRVGGHVLVLATPLAVGLPEDIVQPTDSTQFRPGIEDLGFLYANPEPAYQAAAVKGYAFSLRPSRLIYRSKPTPYVKAVTRAPAGIYCEMYAEDGRTALRSQYQNQTVMGNKK